MPTCPRPVTRAMAHLPEAPRAYSQSAAGRILRHNDAATGGEDMIRLYDPTAEPRAVTASLAPRLTTLQGKRIGILDNGKANAGTLMLAVARTLQERYGAGEIVKREKPVAGPPSPEALEALAQCDLTLVGSA